MYTHTHTYIYTHACRERAEADEAEHIAKQRLADAAEAKKYGWPGAERKMQAAKQSVLDAERELEEAMQAESRVVGQSLSHVQSRLDTVLQASQKVKQELARNRQLIEANSLYMIAMENNPHVVIGKGFRRALRGFDAADGKMGYFLRYLKDQGKFLKPKVKSKEELHAEEEERIRMERERAEAEIVDRNKECHAKIRRLE
jgi:hypothetical protein